MSLNKSQKQAVETINNPLLILAGAGSGKTRVLTYRISFLIKEGIAPHNILAVTFTNKAAEEMKFRIHRILIDSINKKLNYQNESEFDINKKYNDINIGTFHSICAKILRIEAKNINISQNFTIYDRGDQVSLVKNIIKNLRFLGDITPSQVLEMISKAKSELIDANLFLSQSKNQYEQIIAQIYAKYEEELNNASAFDFDDLIFKVVLMFRKYPEILNKYQDKFKYILIDEYQDTNPSQYELVKMLAEKYRNICVVGDDFQSIYSFRQADFRNILNFERDYKDAKIIKLEENYRSTGNILLAAQSVISKNKIRADKNLFTKKEKGNKILIKKAIDEKHEASIVVKEIKKIQKQDKISLNNIVIFFRINVQSRPFEEMLIKEGVNYRTVGLIKFYERREVKDILAYLRLINNPSDKVSFQRIFNIPARGLSAETLKKAINYQKEMMESLSVPNEVIELLGKNKRAISSLEKFLNLFRNFKQEAKKLKLSEFFDFLISVLNYKEYLKTQTNSDDRLDSLNELKQLTEDYVGNMTSEILDEFLQKISLFTNGDEKKDNNNEAITLMTVHSAKGLEFPVVFITGFEYGIFPFYKSLESEENLEEERRLCYVAITRAEKLLYITYASRRTLFGRTQVNPKSIFLDEIPDDVKEII